MFEFYLLFFSPLDERRNAARFGYRRISFHQQKCVRDRGECLLAGRFLSRSEIESFVLLSEIICNISTVIKVSCGNKRCSNVGRNTSYGSTILLTVGQ